MQSETGFPSSHQLKSYVASKSRLKLAARAVLAADDGLLVWVLTITYSQDATTDINAKYVKRHGSAQGCAFWGSQNQNLTSTPPFSQNTTILGPDLDGS